MTILQKRRLNAVFLCYNIHEAKMRPNQKVASLNLTVSHIFTEIVRQKVPDFNRGMND